MPRKEKPGKRAGGVRQRVDGRWEASYYLNGQRQSLYAKTQEEALNKLLDVRVAMRDGLPRPSRERLTVGQWLDYWLANIIEPKREPTPYEQYEIAVRKYIKPTLGQKLLNTLQDEDIDPTGSLPKQRLSQFIFLGRPPRLERGTSCSGGACDLCHKKRVSGCRCSRNHGRPSTGSRSTEARSC